MIQIRLSLLNTFIRCILDLVYLTNSFLNKKNILFIFGFLQMYLLITINNDHLLSITFRNHVLIYLFLIVAFFYNKYFIYLVFIQKNSNEKRIKRNIARKLIKIPPYLYKICFLLILSVFISFSLKFFFTKILLFAINPIYYYILYYYGFWRMKSYANRVIYKTKKKNFRNYLYFVILQLILTINICTLANIYLFSIFSIVIILGNISLINFILKFEKPSIEKIFLSTIIIVFFKLTGFSPILFFINNIYDNILISCSVLPKISSLYEKYCIYYLLKLRVRILYWIEGCLIEFIKVSYNVINKVQLTGKIGKGIVQGIILVNKFIIEHAPGIFVWMNYGNLPPEGNLPSGSESGGSGMPGGNGPGGNPIDSSGLFNTNQDEDLESTSLALTNLDNQSTYNIGVPTYIEPTYTRPLYGTSSYGVHPHTVSNYGAPSYGVHPHTVSNYGAPSYGVHPHTVSSYVPPSFGFIQGRPTYTSSTYGGSAYGRPSEIEFRHNRLSQDYRNKLSIQERGLSVLPVANNSHHIIEGEPEERYTKVCPFIIKYTKEDIYNMELINNNIIVTTNIKNGLPLQSSMVCNSDTVFDQSKHYITYGINRIIQALDITQTNITKTWWDQRDDRKEVDCISYNFTDNSFFIDKENKMNHRRMYYILMKGLRVPLYTYEDEFILVPVHLKARTPSSELLSSTNPLKKDWGFYAWTSSSKYADRLIINGSDINPNFVYSWDDHEKNVKILINIDDALGFYSKEALGFYTEDLHPNIFDYVVEVYLIQFLQHRSPSLFNNLMDKDPRNCLKKAVWNRLPIKDLRSSIEPFKRNDRPIIQNIISNNNTSLIPYNPNVISNNSNNNTSLIPYNFESQNNLPLGTFNSESQNNLPLSTFNPQGVISRGSGLQDSDSLIYDILHNTGPIMQNTNPIMQNINPIMQNTEFTSKNIGEDVSSNVLGKRSRISIPNTTDSSNKKQKLDNSLLGKRKRVSTLDGPNSINKKQRWDTDSE